MYKSNTQVRLPNNLYLGDVDGDGSVEFLQAAGNRLFVFRSNFQATAVLHHYFQANIQRLVTGDFATGGREHGRDQVGVILDDGSFQMYAISDDLTELWWWFTQPNFIASDEHAIVGDFDGDGADDILVYNPANGALRMMTRIPTGFFAPMPNFNLGNLSTANRIHKTILAGEFGQNVGRDDLVVIDYPNGQLSRYDSATDPAGKRTFWWAFTTNAGAIHRNERIAVANVDGGAKDGLVLRDGASGAYRFCKAEFDNGQLAALGGVNVGQLPLVRDTARLVFARVKEAALRNEPGGATRDDAIFCDTQTGQTTRVDGRYDGSHLTYWWAYTKNTPVASDWPPLQHDRWAILLCKFKDQSQEPPTQRPADSRKFFEQFFTGAGIGLGGMADYFRDISYGARDISQTQVKGWYTLPYKLADRPKSTQNPYHDSRVDLFADGITASGLTRLDGGRDKYKDPTSGATYYDAVLILNVPGTGVGGGGGLVVLDPDGWDVATAAQEMHHEYGLNHSRDDRGTEYGDQWDVMSALNSWSYPGFGGENTSTTTAYGTVTDPSGPELNAPHRLYLGHLPTSRVLTVTPNAAHRHTQEITLAALNRPEANGYLAVKIPIQDSAGDHYFCVEFRQQSGFDRGIRQDAVLVHEWKPDNHSYLQQGSNGPELLANDTFKHTKFNVTVKQINAGESTATITLTV